MKDLYQPANLPDEFPGGFYVCSLKRPRRLLFANAEVLRVFDCHDFGELSVHVQGNVDNMLVPEDIQKVHSQIERQMADSGKRFDHIYARIITRKGRTRYVDLSGCLVHSLEEGDLLYCLMTESGRRASDYEVAADIREYVIENIDTALSRGWIHLYYQPVIRNLTRELCGFEVLSRWIDPKIGFLAPNMFIPALEQTRQIHKLDTYILRETCRTLRQRMDKGLPTVPISFNLSRVDFMLLDVFDTIENTMDEFQLPRDLLHIEVTESIVAEDPGYVRATLDRLRAVGYEVWIDDFGSGYSSLNLLKDVECDLIKLDMGFLRTFTDRSRQIIASTIDMAKKLGIKTFMEGVETSEQADFLASIGCGRLQGYFFGKPQPLAGAMAHLEAQHIGIETRRWHPYYDKAASLIHATDEPLAILDFAKDTFHYLYTNEAYCQQIKGIGFTLASLKEALNGNPNSSLYRDMRKLLQEAEKSQRPEVYFCTICSSYIRIRLQAVMTVDGHTLLETTVWNITQDTNHLEHMKFDTNLRYLYMIYDSLTIADFAADTIELLFDSAAAAKYRGKALLPGVRALLAEYENTIVYPADREQYHRFADPDTILQRLKASRDGILGCCVRLKNAKGNYNWALCTTLLIPEGGSQRILNATQSLDNEIGNLPALMRSISDSEAVKNAPKTLTPLRLTANYQAMLWENQMKYSEFGYFWKDRDRRFLGVSQSFLRCYGFTSVKDVLGKNDEDMGWHVADDPYRNAELDVLEKGIVVRNQPGQCIIKGVLHHITCYKWPLYDKGQIVGLMGVFFDADRMRECIDKISDTSYIDTVTGLMNTRGWFDALFTYDEQKTLYKRRYSVLLIENAMYHSIVNSYGAEFAQQLLREEADKIREEAGRDSTIARVKESTFAILSYEKTEAEAETRAQVILQNMQTIHKSSGSPVTLVFQYALAHSTEKGVSAENIYHVAETRLRKHPQKTGGGDTPVACKFKAGLVK